MKKNDEDYRRIEQELFKRIINRKDDIRLNNCLNRTQQQILHLLDLVKKVVEDRDIQIKHYDEVRTKLKSIDSKLAITAEASVNIETIKQVFSLYSHQAFGDFANDKISYNNKDARNKISSFIERVNYGYNKSLDNLLGLTELEKKLYNGFNAKITEIRNELATVTAMTSKARQFNIEHLSYGDPLDIGSFLDLDMIVPNKGNIITRMFGASHSSEDMRSYIEDIGHRLITTPDYKGQGMDYGYLLQDILPAKIKEVDISIDNAKTVYQSHIDKYMEDSTNKILSEIIEHYDFYKSMTDSLKSLQTNLENLICHEQK